MDNLIFATVIILTFVSIVSSDDLVNCRLKKGCHITKCDPAPPSWNNLSNIESQVDRNEYPITCKEKKSGLSADALTILSTLTAGGRGSQGHRGEKGDVGPKGQKGDSGEEFNKNLVETLVAENQKLKSDMTTLNEELVSLRNKLQNLGQSGTVNQKRLEELVRLEVEKKTEEMAAKIKFLEEKHVNITEQMEENRVPTVAELKCAVRNGVKVGTKCFINVVHATQDTTSSQADQICRNKGARLADISSEKEYETIMQNIRNKILPGTTPRNFWTGMKRDKVGNAILSDGQVSPYKKVRTAASEWTRAKWYSQTHVYLYVRPDSSHSDQGLGALSPLYKIEGTLCSMDI